MSHINYLATCKRILWKKNIKGGTSPDFRPCPLHCILTVCRAGNLTRRRRLSKLTLPLSVAVQVADMAELRNLISSFKNPHIFLHYLSVRVGRFV